MFGNNNKTDAQKKEEDKTKANTGGGTGGGGLFSANKPAGGNTAAGGTGGMFGSGANKQAETKPQMTNEQKLELGKIFASLYFFQFFSDFYSLQTIRRLL